MSQINEAYLDRLILDLHHAENTLFNSQNQNSKLQFPKIEKLNDRKVKLISQLKYNACNLKKILTDIENELKSPKFKL